MSSSTSLNQSGMVVEPRPRKLWTSAEDEILRREAKSLLNQEGITNAWSLIAAHLPGRTNKDCRKRWTKVCKKVNKGAWDAEEDQRLLDAVQRYGPCWIQVAEVVQTRHADQCAKRWQQSLDPSLVHAKWTAQDNERLHEAVAMYGRKWKTIAETHFPGRSTTDLKNRYSHLTKDRSMNSAPEASQEILDSDGENSDFDFSFDNSHDNSLSDTTTVVQHGKNTSLPDTHNFNVHCDNIHTMSPFRMETSDLDAFGLPANWSDLDHDTSMFNFDLTPLSEVDTSLGSFPWSSSPHHHSHSHSLPNVTSDPFSTAQTTFPLPMDPAEGRPGSSASSSGSPLLKRSRSTTTLVMEDVDADTLGKVIGILTERKTKMRMECGGFNYPGAME
ncbi:hypothetical protein GQ43DRAFT_3933 [Delitschia confertaspora ATCC 74209]|uniref:Myb-like DNA-binding domain protein n=1 Tax=Delitschia confertaspora ATCC 74209 TaxID=1513339 RepID=A0A9P4MTM0_9PLEO|nr:hypothetical protein GQ43DRAFT_3933 [Delitschia confertaspora ATCC 74209]